METKKQETEFIKEILDTIKEKTDKSKAEIKGCLLLAYDTDKDGVKQHAFFAAGTPANLAESLYSSMMRDPMLANVIIAASNAVVQSRMAEAHIKAETEQKKNKKSKKVNS